MGSDLVYTAADVQAILADHSAVAILGGNQTGQLSPIVSQNAAVYPSTSTSKGAPLLLPSTISAYAVLFHNQKVVNGRYPTSNFVYQGTFNAQVIASNLISWTQANQNSPPDPLPSFSPSAPTFIGNTQWISESTTCSGQTAGTQEVMMDYWYTTTTNAYGTEDWILSYAQHTAEGYDACTYTWVPTTDTEYINAETSGIPGQILASWAPVSNGNSNPISYTIGVGPSGPTASVTYVQNGTPMSWSTSGNPSAGTLTWTNGFGAPGSPSKEGVLFYTLPSAILELDPEFSGGVWPFVDTNTFTATFCAQNAIGGCSADYLSAPQISFNEAIYSTYISYTG